LGRRVKIVRAREVKKGKIKVWSKNSYVAFLQLLRKELNAALGERVEKIIL